MFPSGSTGAFPLGFNAKNSGLRCSPCSSLSWTISCARPSSLSARRTFCGLVNQDQYSFIWVSSCSQRLDRRVAHPRSPRSQPRLSSKCCHLIDPPDRKTVERGEKMRSALLLASSWKKRGIAAVSRSGACPTARGARVNSCARSLRRSSARETCAVGDVGDVAELADERDPALVP